MCENPIFKTIDLTGRHYRSSRQRVLFYRKAILKKKNVILQDRCDKTFLVKLDYFKIRSIKDVSLSIFQNFS